MTTLGEVVSDLRAEVATLDAILAPLDEQDWYRPTPAEGWDIRDTLAHLADTDDLMFEETTGRFSEARSNFQGASLDDFTAWQVERGRSMKPSDVFDWWRSATARLHAHLESCDPKGRFSWRGNMISPLSLASARMMETWAHSQDCHDALGVPFPATDRLRNIAQLGARALPHAFRGVGLQEPAPVRLELTTPSGVAWTFGDEGAPNMIRGAMADWCQIVGRRDRDGSNAARMDADGPDVANILVHASAF